MGSRKTIAACPVSQTPDPTCTVFGPIVFLTASLVSQTPDPIDTVLGPIVFLTASPISDPRPYRYCFWAHCFSYSNPGRHLKAN
jgi:hypothetical protein